MIYQQEHCLIWRKWASCIALSTPVVCSITLFKSFEVSLIYLCAWLLNVSVLFAISLSYSWLFLFSFQLLSMPSVSKLRLLALPKSFFDILRSDVKPSAASSLFAFNALPFNFMVQFECLCSFVWMRAHAFIVFYHRRCLQSFCAPVILILILILFPAPCLRRCPLLQASHRCDIFRAQAHERLWGLFHF